MEGEAQRSAGVLVPLFALRGARDWGIGDIGHVAPFCRWLAAAGHRWLQLLPIAEMAPGERSPYAALTAFAVDPIYVAIDRVEDFAAAGGEGALRAEARDALAVARSHPEMDYDAVRRAKRAALEIAFAHFRTAVYETSSPRSRAFDDFRARTGWLGEYALFRALHERAAEQPWTTWAPGLREHAAEALGAARRAAAERVVFQEYVQWLAAEQWAEARRAAAAVGVRLAGDLPFMVSWDSADVWSRQDEFQLDASLGAPPDAFDAAGQHWGLPVCRWEVMAGNDFAWLRARAANMSVLFDAVRLDHVVGFYRMYVIPSRGRPAFVPPDEADQLPLGERLLRVVQGAASGMAILGEDLGVVPPFVRRSLAQLGIPGYRVLRWEQEDGAFHGPSEYPARSIATSGTHDTSPLATWWEDELAAEARAALVALPGFAALRAASDGFSPLVRDTLLEALYAAGSDLLVVPLPDLYGGRERINTPATVGRANWAYRVPWTVEALLGGAADELRDRLRALVERHAR